jgi:hypothetical protein
VNTLGTAPSADAPRSGAVHLILRRERDLTRYLGRRRKPSSFQATGLPIGIPRQPHP